MSEIDKTAPLFTEFTDCAALNRVNTQGKHQAPVDADK